MGRGAAGSGLAVGAAALAVWCGPAPAAQCPDPFEFLGPSIVLNNRDRQRMATGEPLVRMLPGEGREISVLGAMAVDIDGERLVAWMRRIEELKKGPSVPAIRRFSEPPTLDDLSGHVLENADVERLRRCRVGSCDLKLTAPEIVRVNQELTAAGADWKRAAQETFRRLILDRVTRYRASGQAAIGIYADGHTDTPLADIARRLLDRSPYLTTRLPSLVDYLTRYPNATLPGAESFLYWSIEKPGGRPVTSVTHVTILRPAGPGLPATLVVGKQVFATHYQNGSLGLTLLLRGCPGPPNYLVYVSRSEVDVIRGVMGWLARRIIQGRVENEATEILTGLRERLSRPPKLGTD